MKVELQARHGTEKIEGRTDHWGHAEGLCFGGFNKGQVGFDSGFIRLTLAGGEETMKEDVLVLSGYHNKVSKTGCFKEQKFYFSVSEVGSLKLR